MPLSEEAMRHLEEQIPELAEAALKQAYWQALASGSSVLVSDNGALYEVFPDNTRKFVKAIEPPVPVPVGEKRVLLP